MSNVNILAVIVAALTSFLLGGLWYSNALFGAAYRGWNTLLALLIEKGADVNALSKAGLTPWLAASGFGDRLGGVLYNKEGADILIAHGADPKLGKPCQAQNKCR